MPLAVIRPDEWELPLFLHVLGAMVLIGALFFVAVALLLAWGRGEDEGPVALRRWAFRAMFAGVLPGYILMRIGAQWVESREELSEADEDSAWIGIGYITADIGMLLILISLILSGVGLRKLQGHALGRVVGVVSVLLLVAYLVAVWAMTVKPS